MTRRERVLCSAVLALLAVPVSAAGPSEWALHAGSFNATKGRSSTEMGFELRFATPWERAEMIAGAAGTENSSFWVWAGARYTFPLDDRWSFSLGLAGSLYEEGDGKNLGGTFQFRSNYEISRSLSRSSRLGLVFYHLSNAGIYDLNPGSNSIVLAWTFGRRSAAGSPQPPSR